MADNKYDTKTLRRQLERHGRYLSDQTITSAMQEFNQLGGDEKAFRAIVKKFGPADKSAHGAMQTKVGAPPAAQEREEPPQVKTAAAKKAATAKKSPRSSRWGKKS